MEVQHLDRIRPSGDCPTAPQIEAWLAARLAQFLGIAAERIDSTVPFSDYALDSSVAVTVTTEMGNWLGRDLEPTLFWEFINIESVAEHLGA
ncbi:acyl carrier protein [Gloeobacter violaceus]|uniref:Gsl1943 protein n=1 Tax=Gloeobacter violaceus (strain ATCC 29082 / PCC 7421) TaxID=251221 RepID=Q7NJ89_GLOVI|nr:acyl carrier protein [Gloeobacter violaceus]BAC89884.1 gsl1943 [Gloeobacter violaceus PCC 7421]